MSLSSFVSDLYHSFTVSEVHAEAPPAAEKDDSADAAGSEDTEDKKDEGEAEEEEDDSEEEEDDDEDEPEDLLPKLQEDCANSSECKPYKHHYDECVERVTSAESDESNKGPKEDCVEEFFHMMHCSAQCAAPKLFAQLK